MGQPTGSLEIERTGDVADARCGVAVLPEEKRCDILDLASACCFDHGLLIRSGFFGLC